ncbi:MAG TPA: hypothetical protein VJX29_06065 [Candidatus Acidoferrales bacterium]|nr:hypothetical protein [Candidatus Acidoferrales bacterium]
MRNTMAASLGSTILATAIFALAALAQPQSQSQNPPQEQPQTPPAVDSVADAARKAKSDKPKTATKKVYTEDDMHSLKSGGLSVVGEKDSDAAADSGKSETSPAGAGAKTEKDEAYWRGRAQKIRDQMAAVDQEIAKVQDEIKKGGAAGFDAQTGRNQNVVFFEDRNAKLKNLEKKKDELQKQMDALEEEARQADVPVGWLR